MRAIRVREFGGPDVLVPEEADLPDPGSGQLRVKLFAAGVNPVETYIRSGQYGRLPDLPYVPGTDGAGVVEAVGDGLQSGLVGQRVYVAGSLTESYSEACLCLPSQVHLLPDGVSFPQGASIGIPYATAHVALFHRANAVRGETILVHGGTGGVGLAAVHWAKHHGLRVLATAGSDPGVALLLREGADAVFRHDDPGHIAEILSHSEGRGVDVVVEMAAHAELGHVLPLLATGGRVAVVGSRGRVEIDPRDLMTRSADVRGVMLGATPQDVLEGVHSEIGAGLAAGWLRPVVGRSFPLHQAAEAHRAVSESKALGKVVLETCGENP